MNAYWHYCHNCNKITPNYYNGLDAGKQYIKLWCKCCRKVTRYPNTFEHRSAFKKTWMCGPVPRRLEREYGWIYVSLDPYKPERLKIGETKRSPKVRERDRTANPDYRLHTAYAVPIVYRKRVEKSIHNLCSRRGNRLSFPNGEMSEWFEISYQDAVESIEEVLIDFCGIDDVFQDDFGQWCFHRIKHVEPQFEPCDVPIPEVERM
ncbi:GIY-YIG nuclease family protein [Vibrio parahaemolyticus]|nr:GIY-YIG nuclease family protein [Vibrio alginolyticus]EHR1162082.1 GIY-YIG nuclease family protein [Vibrio parahaemolyticus]ELA9431981.1 GIY-YIG nuclease family protein [Vibrio parahaemolyticus]